MAKSKSTPVKQEDDVITINIQPFILPFGILVSVLIISLFIFFGLNNIANAIKEAGGVVGTVEGTANTGDSAADDSAGDTVPTAAPPVTEGSTSIDDDPILGNREDAKVAIVEFSDYECPFCKRHHSQTKDQIIENFVETGDAILVFRDFPLSFHDPLASIQAQAAECVQDLAGDEAYFAYGGAIFDTTSSNGNGMSEELLYTDLAEDVGVDGEDIRDCVESEKFAEEVASDMSEGQAAGISGTPGFIIGTLNDDGTVDGEVVSGAQSYSVFEDTIEKYL